MNELSLDTYRYWMSRLLRCVSRMKTDCDVPIAAVILNGAGQCVGWGRNSREKNQDPMGHAELIALRQAAVLRGSWRFDDCTLIVTLEPCPMCAGALVQARMKFVVYGSYDYKRGALGGTVDLSNHASAHHYMKTKGGLEGTLASEVLETWFRRRRIS
uniref:Cytidine/deoxycytidylate deaminase family protein n=1 Tax=Paulinella chromatophora TaxID=39717 RepID=B1X430_PAUCH|nr:cytidine/deoxycytidylate deaminase family protein [Paulinella chromatophora]ACB42699.1 cytidine/deoxycytidylate deaminase family protein [Paulinella chromatophora]